MGGRWKRILVGGYFPGAGSGFVPDRRGFLRVQSLVFDSSVASFSPAAPSEMCHAGKR